MGGQIAQQPIAAGHGHKAMGDALLVKVSADHHLREARVRHGERRRRPAPEHTALGHIIAGAVPQDRAVIIDVRQESRRKARPRAVKRGLEGHAASDRGAGGDFASHR
jgi:hypothetical protein